MCFSILYEDNHLLVVDKAGGVPAQPDASGDAALDDRAKDYLRERYGKPGEVYLGLVHRLDRPTSGVVVLAKTSKAAGRLADAFRVRAVTKRYLALVECHSAPPEQARFRDVLAPLANGGMQVIPDGRKGMGGGRGIKTREADLAVDLAGIRMDGRRALFRVSLHTGVKHQIRCQLAWRGLPVVGDFRYGPGGGPARPEAVAGGRAILLHASSVAFEHPVRREPVEFTAPVPDYWQPFLDAIPDWKPSP